MKQIAVLSTDSIVNRKIEYYCKQTTTDFSPVFLESEGKSLEYLNYELPEISILNLSDPKINMRKIIKIIEDDPWIHYGGIIAIHNFDDEAKLESSLKNNNIISLISMGSMDFNFPRVLKILNQNRQIIFQREIQRQLLTSISGSFIIDNDPFDVKTYSNLVSNYLYNSNFINSEDKDGLHVSLMELLINAIEHGNCRISGQEKSKWLDGGKNIFDLMREKNKNSQIAKRKIYFKYRIMPKKSTTFVIKDEGEGFDWRKRVKQITDKNYLLLHGRGIMMADHYVKNLSYNKNGNEVSFEMAHQVNESNVLPGVFNDQEERVFENGETVFTVGEESNFLYYIVSGKLKIISKGKILTRLTPDDIFLGEMSFLLNNRRSATVKSEGRSVLLKISKKSFVTAVKENPHYGILLSRLLAQRLDRLNQLF